MKRSTIGAIVATVGAGALIAGGIYLERRAPKKPCIWFQVWNTTTNTLVFSQVVSRRDAAAAEGVIRHGKLVPGFELRKIPVDVGPDGRCSIAERPV